MLTTEAVIINCHRPDNVLKILERIQPQVTMTTVLDCAERNREWPSDRTIRITPKSHDSGPWTRYAATGFYEQEFTLLIDDDLLPDTDMVHRFMAHINDYDLVSGMGRLLTDEGGYKRGNCPSGDADIAVRCYFWRTTALRLTLPKAMKQLTLQERWYDDDIAMCLFAQKKVFILPGKVPWTELPCPNACSSRPGHVARRDILCKRIARLINAD